MQTNDTKSADVICIRCGHDIRGIDEHGTCPGCSASVLRSIRSVRLSKADPGWLSKISKGYWLLRLSIGIIVLAIIALPVLTMPPVGPSLKVWVSPKTLDALLLCLWLCAIAIAIVSIFIATSRDPIVTQTERFLSPRILARIGAVAAIVVVLFRFSLNPEIQPIASHLLYLLWTSLITLGIVSFDYYAIELAYRVPDHELGHTTRRAANRLAVAYSIMVLFYITTAVLLNQNATDTGLSFSKAVYGITTLYFAYQLLRHAILWARFYRHLFTR